MATRGYGHGDSYNDGCRTGNKVISPHHRRLQRRIQRRLQKQGGSPSSCGDDRSIAYIDGYKAVTNTWKTLSTSIIDACGNHCSNRNNNGYKNRNLYSYSPTSLTVTATITTTVTTKTRTAVSKQFPQNGSHS